MKELSFLIQAVDLPFHTS